jgi:hypothetical protein
MTIAAIQSEAGDVMLVAEGNGLLEGDVYIGFIGRPFDDLSDDAGGRQKSKCTENGDFRDRVGSWSE